MKKALKIILYTIGSVLGFIILVIIVVSFTISISRNKSAKMNARLAGPEVSTLTIDSFSFRDLNKNGKLDVYEDIRQPLEERVNDLLSQMNLEEKAGTMFIPPVSMKKDGNISEKPALNDIFSFMSKGTSELLFGKKINHFNIFAGTRKQTDGRMVQRLQKLAERTRLGIPISIASDPRNHFSNNPLAGIFAGDFSLFPEPLGLAAIGDSLELPGLQILPGKNIRPLESV